MKNSRLLWHVTLLASLVVQLGETAGCFPSFEVAGAAGSSSTAGAGGANETGAVAATSSGASTGAGVVGACADGTIEVNMGPKLAGCAGAWQEPGIVSGGSLHCGRQAGNTGIIRAGVGCGADDLCNDGFHVCLGEFDVGASVESTKTCVDYDFVGGFFATAQPSKSTSQCGTVGDNDLFGCGAPDISGSACVTLKKTIGTYAVPAKGKWNLIDNDHERTNVTKQDPDVGGVLCCLN